MNLAIYDILTGTPESTEEAQKLVLSTLPERGIDLFKHVTLLRLSVIDGKPVSACLAVTREDNTYELYYHNWDGYSHETATNPDHHHISFVLSNLEDYLSFLGASRFTFSSSRDTDFILKRFPMARKVDDRLYEVVGA